MDAGQLMSAVAPLPADHDARMQRVSLALDGLSLGDSFGQHFFAPELWRTEFNSRELPPAPWAYTDDTEMALAIADVLASHGEIDQDQLAAGFARRFGVNPYRGYGSGAIEVLQAIEAGRSWRDAAAGLFDGRGSLGNGAAMRAAPVGAYFAGDFGAVVEQARKSAEVTHMHLDGIAGAIAVAVAAAWAAERRATADANSAASLFACVLEHTPESATRRGIEAAARLPLEVWEFHAAEKLGSGADIRSADTVPFCLWVVARHLDDFTEALWTAARVGGDADTTGAIIGGIVALAVGPEGLPINWLARREELYWLRNH
jgi:ADP-ribosylglycohydrolase